MSMMATWPMNLLRFLTVWNVSRVRHVWSVSTSTFSHFIRLLEGYTCNTSIYEPRKINVFCFQLMSEQLNRSRKTVFFWALSNFVNRFSLFFNFTHYNTVFGQSLLLSGGVIFKSFKKWKTEPKNHRFYKFDFGSFFRIYSKFMSF